jgi:prepilin signal peptidase PulO-like enzyme (type II secretory pathway)
VPAAHHLAGQYLCSAISHSKARPLLPGAHFPALSADGTGQRTAICADRISADAGITAAGGLILLSTLLVLAIIDGQTQLLPDRLTLPLLWAGLLFNLNGTFVPLSEAVIGAMTGLSLWTVYWLFRLLTGKEALGYGDFKLLAALGAWSAGRSCRRRCCAPRPAA